MEGLGLSVLRGFPWSIDAPEVILCEFEDFKTLNLGHSWGDICEYLNSRDYTVYVSEWHPVVRHGIAHDWCAMKRYPCKLESVKSWGNIIAFKTAPGDVELTAKINEQIYARY